MSKYIPNPYAYRDMQSEFEPRRKGSGFFSRILACVLGMIIGVGSIAGAGVAIYSYVNSKTIKETVTLLGVNDLFFAENGILSKEYENQYVSDLINDITTAVGEVTGGTASLSTFANISPKIKEFVTNLVDTLNEANGIQINAEKLMTKKFVASSKDDKEVLIPYLFDCIYNTSLVSFLGEENVMDNSMMMNLCYGEKGVAYEIDETTGKVIMYPGYSEKTINDLKNTNQLFNDLKLKDLMDVSPDNALIMYVLYGKKGMHYTLIDEEDRTLTPINSLLQVAIYNGKIYTEYGEELTGIAYTLNGTTSCQATIGGTTVPFYFKLNESDKLSITVDGKTVKADLYYVYSNQDTTDIDNLLKKQVAVYNGNLYNEYGLPIDGTISEDGTSYTVGETIRYLIPTRINGEQLKFPIIVDGNTVYANLYYACRKQPAVQVLQKQVAIYNNQLFDEYGDPLGSAYQLSTDGTSYTYTDGEGENATTTTYKLTQNGENKITVTIEEDEYEAQLYYVSDKNNKPIMFEPTSINDLTQANSPFEKITSQITLGELMDEEKIESDLLLKHFKDKTIDSLLDSTNTLTINELFATDIYLTAPEGATVDLDGTEVKQGDFIVMVGEKQYDETGKMLFFDKTTNAPLFKKVPDDAPLSEREIKNGPWKYMLSNPQYEEGSEDPLKKDKYLTPTINEMGSLISNMTTNIQTATLNDLVNDGILSLDDGLLNKEVEREIKIKVTIPNVGEQTATKPIEGLDFLTAEQTTIGQLNTKELSSYLNAILNTFDTEPEIAP